MASEIRTLKDGDIEIHPRTVAQAVHTPSGSTIDVEIENAKAETDIKLGDINSVLETILSGPTLEEVNAKIDEINGTTTGNTTMEKLEETEAGKAFVAGAITEKGVTTAANATFQQMATNIGQIETGGQPGSVQITYGGNSGAEVYFIDNSGVYQELNNPSSINVTTPSLVFIYASPNDPRYGNNADVYGVSGGEIIDKYNTQINILNDVRCLVLITGPVASISVN